MIPRDWSTWIAIASVAAGGIARTVGTEQKLDGVVQTVAAHEQRHDRADERVRQLEQNRELERQIAALAAEVAALRAEFRAGQARRRIDR